MKNPHTISIKNLKHMPSMSEETYCFTCSVLLDGKKTWEAKNNGQGEQTRLYYLKPTTERGEEHDTSAIADIVDKCVEDAILAKQKQKDLAAVANKLKKQLCFRVKGQRPDAYYHIRTATPNDPEVRKKVFGKHDIELVINDLPVEEAIKYFFKYSE